MTERLDRIERVLEVLASNQAAEGESRLALREELELLYQNQLTERDSRLEIRADLDILYQVVQQTGENINQLAEEISQLSQATDALLATTQQNQIEIRRIWEYLMRQSPNGHGEGT
jgi:hypothetical protein